MDTADTPRTYRCPTEPEPGVTDSLIGCGHTFTATPDDEGLVDCPNCGIWFRANEQPNAPEAQ